MKKKHKKHTLWSCNDNYGTNLVNPIYTSSLPKPSKIAIPDQIVLQPSEPGVFFGTRSRDSPTEYIGMPQGAEGNILIIGGNGSGKSSGIAKPTLLTWKGALCTTDIKGELSDYYKTLYQQKKVTRPYIIFDPTHPETPGYDPFDWLLEDGNDNLVKNIWEIATAIIILSPDDKQPFWVETEQALFSAALLHYFNLGLSFSETVCKIMATSTSLLCTEITGSHDKLANIFLGEAGDMKPEVLAAVDRGLRNKLMLFATDPYISHAFRGTREGANCFAWSDLDKYNIFLRVPADRVDQWGGAINLMYTQLIRHLERRPDKYSVEEINNVPVLLLMDEFARFGKLEMITSAMSTLRSKGVNICPIIQSMAQLDKIYGEHDRRIILDNCQYQAILRANDADTQKYLCELIGTTTGIQRSISETLDESLSTIGYNKSITETRDFRVFPHELSTLEDICLLTPYGFYKVEKFHLYNSNAENQKSLTIFPEHSVIKIEAADTYVYDPEADIHEGKNIRIIMDASVITTLIEPCPNNFIENGGAKMLTIEERITNATNKIAKATKQQKLQRRQEQEEQTKKDQRQNYIIGELFAAYFPMIRTLEPGTAAENEVRFRPLKSFLSELASDQELVKKFTEIIQNGDEETIHTGNICS